jgi:hypothetical protein
MTTMLLHIHAVAEAGASLLLSCLLEGGAVVLFAWLLLRVLGWQNSGTRFAIWFLVCIAPLASFGGRFSYAASEWQGGLGPNLSCPPPGRLSSLFPGAC